MEGIFLAPLFHPEFSILAEIDNWFRLKQTASNKMKELPLLSEFASIFLEFSLEGGFCYLGKKKYYSNLNLDHYALLISTNPLDFLTQKSNRTSSV